MEHWEITDLDGVVPLPGAMRLLHELPTSGWTIVTSCTRPLAEARICAAGLPLPNQLVTADDVQHGKPNAEPYLKGAALLGFAPVDCLVVEDAPAGIRAGKAAGASVLALRTTEEDAEISAAGADWIVSDLASLGLNPPKSNRQIELQF
jgi:sugar-phosphatase